MRSIRTACLLVLAFAACSKKTRTELIVVFDTDLAIPAEIDQMQVQAFLTSATPSDGGPVFERVYNLGTELQLPASLGFVPRSDTDLAFRIVARGLKQGAPVVTRSATTSFLPDQTIVLTIRLLRACTGNSCDGSGQTCNDKGICAPDSVSPDGLPPYGGPATLFDGSVTSGSGGKIVSDAGAGGAGAGGTAGTGGSGAGGSGGSGSGSGGSGGSGSGSGGSALGSGGASAPLSGMPIPPGLSNVPKPSGTPTNLIVRNWMGFSSAVTYTFDDANSSQIASYSQLNGLGVRMTFYIWTGKAEASNAIWGQAVKDGHELGNHTQTHSSTASGPEVDNATTFLVSKWNAKPYTMAAPNGIDYTAIAQTRFLINRGVGSGMIAPNDSTSAFKVPCFLPQANAPASAFNAQVDNARKSGTWLTVLVHGFTGGTDGAYNPVALADFLAAVKYAQSFPEIWIDSMVNVGAYWIGQRVFTAVTPTTAGNTKTWTWTLPANFPPGKYLRVKVDGGTLSQNGTPLAWYPNGGGFYEVALDAGSLTLAP